MTKSEFIKTLLRIAAALTDMDMDEILSITGDSDGFSVQISEGIEKAGKSLAISDFSDLYYKAAFEEDGIEYMELKVKA